MSAFNKVILLGNLTRDPEIKYTAKGTAIANIGMAINRKWRNDAGEEKEDVAFVDLEAFGKTAESIGQYLKKGHPLFVEGRLRTNSWDDKQSGQKRSKMVVTIENMQFIGGKADHGESAPASRPATQRQTTAARQTTMATTPKADADPPPEDDVPF